MKKLTALLLAAAMVFCLAACSDSSKNTASASDTSASPETQKSAEPAADATNSADSSADSDLAYVTGRGKLVVGITDFAPMDYKDDNSNWIGFDADMATAFAKSIGVDVEFVEIDWDNKILELNSKNIDCVWNGMTLTDEVTNSMECSNAYCNNAQVVVVNSADKDKYSTQDSIVGLSLAVEAGSAGEEAANALGYDYIEVESQAAALMEVSAGTSDACIIDLLMAGAMIGEGTSYPDLTYTVALNPEQYGVGFRQGSDLASALNDFFKTSYADGSMMATAKTYGVQESIIAQ